MYQSLTVVGNLGRDPEMKYLPNGTAVTNFSMATTAKWKSPAGEPMSATTWFKVAVWGASGEACNQYLRKGSQVLVEGTLKPDEYGNPRVWENNDGISMASFELTARTVKFLTGSGVQGEAVEDAEEPTDIPF